MRKLLYVFVALMAFAACTSERAPFNYRGLPFTLTTTQLIDSMQARGFVFDSVASDSGRTAVFAKSGVPYRVLIAFAGEKLRAIQETYSLSTNDSTRRLWQELRDGLEKELDAWPDCPMLKEDHKVANFDATDGLISVILENTYRPSLTVRYIVKEVEK